MATTQTHSPLPVLPEHSIYRELDVQKARTFFHLETDPDRLGAAGLLILDLLEAANERPLEIYVISRQAEPTEKKLAP